MADVQLPRILEPPPKSTGDAQNDYPLLINWIYRAYQNIQQIAFYIKGQVDTPEFNPSDLPDPATATTASAQETANNAYTLASQNRGVLRSLISGTVTISELDDSATFTFSSAQSDTAYTVILQPKESVGSPGIDSFIVKSKTYTTSGFTFTIGAAPGEDNSVTFEWQLIRKAT